MNATAIILGLIAGAYFLGWALDVGGWTTRLLKRTYEFFGEGIWPFGDEHSYVRFMRYGAWVGVVIASIAVVVGVIHA
jgi:hypothetical protein